MVDCVVPPLVAVEVVAVESQRSEEIVLVTSALVLAAEAEDRLAN
jgi:hypothetical protein